MTSINLQEIERLTAKKAKEWKDANCLQISSLTAALEKKESECLQYKEMLIDLKTNFKYNLGVSSTCLSPLCSVLEHLP